MHPAVAPKVTLVLPAVTQPSWDELAQRLTPFVRRRVCNDSDAADVMQDVLLRVHKGVASVRDGTRLTAWLYSVARTAIADHGRVKARHPVRSSDAVVEASHEPFAEDGDLVSQELALYLQGFVALLPEHYREVVRRTEFEGESHKQVAADLGLSVSAVKSRVQRGRVKLRALLEACCEIAVDARGKVVSCAPHPASPIPDCSC